jgi:glycosyltransferase involved in cell wall biosynthesis
LRAGDIVVSGVPATEATAIGILDRAIRPGAAETADSAPEPGDPQSLVVGIDAELINASLTGTFEAGLAISLAIARQPGVATVFWIAQPDRVEPLRELLEAKAIASITVVTLEQLVADGARVDVAFRPYQDFLARTWPLISRYSARNVVWTLDLIANVTPSYAKSVEDYHRLNRTSAQAWENADAIGVLTPHVGSMLEAYQGGEPDARIFVLPAGAPEGAVADPDGPFDDEALQVLDERQFVLVLGNNYLHKGRAWFIRIARIVLGRGWGGSFVLVGPTPAFGSSTALEAVELASADSSAFIVAGRVGGADRARLLARATLTAAPSVTEGWGMTPSEALAHGSTPLASLGGGLRDITPPAARHLLMSDDGADADTLETLLRDEGARAGQRAAWLQGMAQYSWDAAAATLVERMRATLAAPRHFTALVRDEDIALDAVRPLHWRVLDRVLPQGGRFRTAVASAVRRILRRGSA